MNAKLMCKVTKGVVGELVDYILGKVQNFSALDFTVLKVCLSTTGVLLGVAFSKSLKKLVPILAIISLASYLYLIFKLFIEDN